MRSYEHKKSIIMHVNLYDIYYALARLKKSRIPLICSYSLIRTDIPNGNTAKEINHTGFDHILQKVVIDVPVIVILKIRKHGTDSVLSLMISD